MREDIRGGLKNALERGETIEQAIRSFINAGYNETEVREAANQIIPGVISTLDPQRKVPALQTNKPKPVFKPLTTQPQAPGTRDIQPRTQLGYQIKTPKPRRNTRKIIALTIILLILVSILATTIIFRKEIVDFLTSIF